ncbi:alpha subunit of putative methylmalonyl-CoA decarboxylase [Aspergillus campestris IBT 28561]|uniref:Propionyl-CoA carboxylase beta chain, mitochondrial n=1 Tax=Aspergillus campestris (strain IBT 28561) TaxID=1392248 RepID=A0A2I1D8H1_ASPC2|nr:alpha subunit of putative methylmalonyl-CoA decarboxylase [Aspergillus campestris IBT 28561]PKY06183.1 alpha subunit of putative methylmalonyl-CoA decarboxylase [Aspergillus campestris IBT 28561]
MPDNKATKRLKQVSSHLAPKLPADYSDVRDQINTLREIAATPDPSRRGYVRQKQAGKLWVRERLEQLLDRDTFTEIGSVSGTVKWEKTGPMREKPVSFVPSNNVQGMGRLRGRKVLLTADDFSLRSGHADGSTAGKTIYVEKLALALKLPVVKLVDGSSGGGSVTTIAKAGWSYLPYVPMYKQVVEQLNQGIPNLGAVVGPAIGLGAARVVSCHFSVMAADIGALFNAGPEVVKGATFEEGLDFQDLGGPMIHCTNGTIDNMAANEAECYEQLRTVLGYLPNHGKEAPPIIACEDPPDREDESLRKIIPRRQTRMYNPWTIIKSVVDHDSWFEIGALWGRTAIGGLARLGGRPVGIISLNCEVNGGALDAAGSQKLARLLKLCDVMNLPVLQFIDVPGYAIGTVAERTATMRWGVELAKAYFATTTPLFNVITRRAFGVAGGIMLGARDPVMQVAWPSGQWGSLPLEGGIEVAHRHELREAEKVGKKAERYQELEEEYRRMMSPVRTANAFGVEEIIDPKDTRSVCCAWARHMYEALMPERLADRATGKIHPVFT